MDAPNAVIAPPKKELCVTAYIMTREILLDAGNPWPNFDDLYGDVKSSLLRQQQQQQRQN